MKSLFLYLSIIALVSFVTILGCGLSDNPFCGFLSDNSVYFGSASIHLGLFSLAMFFLWKDDFRSTLESVGFPGSLKWAVVNSAAILVSIFVALFILGYVSLLLGFNDQEKIAEKVGGLPFPILIFAALVAPISEELFFRGLLTPRIGVVFSSLAFGLSHLAYGSTVEVAGTVVVGIILGFAFRMSKSVTPCILAHMAYNSLAVLFYTFVLNNNPG